MTGPPASPSPAARPDSAPGRRSLLPAWLPTLRLVKFGTVGASGVVVNLAALYACREYLLAGVASPSLRLDLSLAIAIFCATVNNFTWNRLWTWRDRGRATRGGLVPQFLRYALACWVGILLQFVITRWLAGHLYYLLANLIAIGAASLFNFLLNDRWTFGRRRVAPTEPRPVEPR